jgi:hypothetical protein
MMGHPMAKATVIIDRKPVRRRRQKKTSPRGKRSISDAKADFKQK